MTPVQRQTIHAPRVQGKSVVDKMPSPSFAENARVDQVWVDESAFYAMVSALRTSLYALEHGSLLNIQQIIRDALKQAGVEAE